jgi:transcriptional regulator with XRE-family HTH domain
MTVSLRELLSVITVTESPEMFERVRKVLGWNRKDLEKRCGVPVWRISKFERGGNTMRADIELLREAIRKGLVEATP